MKAFLKAILFILCLFGTIIINQLYFEYCVSRPCDEWIAVTIAVAILALDISMFVLAIKTLKKILKL